MNGKWMGAVMENPGKYMYILLNWLQEKYSKGEIANPENLGIYCYTHPFSKS